MSNTTIKSSYHLLIDDDLRVLIEEALALDKAYNDSKEHSERRQDLENRLYDKYQEIGWSVVYEIKESPF